jgi:hypothetical protein
MSIEFLGDISCEQFNIYSFFMAQVPVLYISNLNKEHFFYFTANVPRIVVSHSMAVLHWELSLANLMRTSALLLCLERLRFSRSMTTIPSPWRMGAGWRRWRLSWLIAWQFWWLFVASLAWVPLTLAPCALTVMSVCSILFVDLLLGDVRREFMQRVSAARHGTLGSYLRDAFQEGSADAVACLPFPRA